MMILCYYCWWLQWWRWLWSQNDSDKDDDDYDDENGDNYDDVRSVCRVFVWRQGWCLRGSVVPGSVAQSVHGQCPLPHLLWPSYHKARSPRRSSRLLSGIRQLVLAKPRPHLQPQTEGMAIVSRGLFMDHLIIINITWWSSLRKCCSVAVRMACIFI